jgi:CHAT domain-containing protein/Tfp pilus assembly protein PilF
MKHVAVLALLVVAGACAAGNERRLAATFEESKAAVRRGELAQARALAERGESLAPRDSEWAWTFRLYRGEILLLQHEPVGVESLVTSRPPADAAFDAVRGRQKYLEARLQLTQNHLNDALTSLQAAHQLAKAAHDLELDITWLDGQIRLRLGKWSDGESRLNEVIERAASAGDRFHQARARNDLGMGKVVRGRFDEALQQFERVLSFTDLEQLTVYGEALNNAGLCYARLGEFERALTTQRRAVSMHQGRGPRLDLVRALGELGNTFQQQGEPRSALPHLRQALATATAADLKADAAVWAGNLAAADIDVGEWNEAEHFNEEAKRLKAVTHAGNLVHNTLNAALIAQGRGRLDEAAHLFDEALAGAAAEPSVRWSAHAGLAAIALGRSQPGEAARHFEAALDTIDKTRSELLKTEYKLSFLTRLIQFYRSYVDALVNQGRIDRALEVLESSRGRVLGERNGLAAPAKTTAAGLRRLAAQSGTVFLSYWLGPSRSYLWVVTPATVRSFSLPPASAIEPLVRQHQAAVNNALVDPLAAAETAGERLYDLLVAPALPLIPPHARIVIVADGALHGINFETLPVPGVNRHYLIEDAEIETAPALSMLSAAPPVAAAAPSLLLFGDPVARLPEFPALKYAAAEIANVSKHFPAERVATYQGDRASPQAYRAAMPERFAFVHFAAHASANLQSPLDSAVILTGGDSAYKLYARDVAQVPLHAQLVTVSACRSAGERAYSGEGLVGFAWAFLRAGATRVIAGLWDVDDRSTAELMEQLYARIARGDPVPRALRAAKLALLAEGGVYAKPYYWAPFQVFTVVP